jgi:hypothetical protein
MHLVSSKVSRLTIYECKSLQKKIHDQRATGRSSGALPLRIPPRRMGSEEALEAKEGFTVLKKYFLYFFQKIRMEEFWA